MEAAQTKFDFNAFAPGRYGLLMWPDGTVLLPNGTALIVEKDGDRNVCYAERPGAKVELHPAMAREFGQIGVLFKTAGQFVTRLIGERFGNEAAAVVIAGPKAFPDGINRGVRTNVQFTSLTWLAEVDPTVPGTGVKMIELYANP